MDGQTKKKMDGKESKTDKKLSGSMIAYKLMAYGIKKDNKNLLDGIILAQGLEVTLKNIVSDQ